MTTLLSKESTPWTSKQWISLLFAVLFIFAIWFYLDQKLLFGKSWISPTYDNPSWVTQEGNLPTYGVWDFETHVWKTEFIMSSFPNYQWNPYWYLGMPLLKYYQSAFYVVNIIAVLILHVDPPRAELLLVIFGHLLAVLMTFLLCLKISGRRIWASALCAVFLLGNTFLTLRSYGWEPITVVFLFLFPLTLLVFFKNPEKPFRLSLIIMLAICYLAHPLIFFSVCMTMGIYLFSIAIDKHPADPTKKKGHYIWQYFGAIFCSLFIGAVQFFPEVTYHQVTSGAHLGVSYLPLYQIPFNIISLASFFFDSSNLLGPGPIILIAVILISVFIFLSFYKGRERLDMSFFDNKVAKGLSLVLFFMVLFYYFEKFNLFPMNLLGSIQYHRIIPEFIIVSAVVITSLSKHLTTKFHKIMYYTILITFVLASFIIVYNIQTHWQTSSSISNAPEFIVDNSSGRISFPYTDQSLSVRSPYNNISEVYGYYEQGITNPYADEIFSVSSGYQSYANTILYLQAADVNRLYVNTQTGERDAIMRKLLAPLPFVWDNSSRYGYFVIPLSDSSFAQTITVEQANTVKSLEPGCRIMFQVKYCGSVGEEFVDSDTEEVRYIQEYVSALDAPHTANASFEMVNPNQYDISVVNATNETDIVVKMTYDKDFRAYVGKKEIKIEEIGPYFMLMSPQQAGKYEITLVYDSSHSIVTIGAIVSIISLIVILILFSIKRFFYQKKNIFRRGDL